MDYEEKFAIARKRAIDPAQEHLREQKALWNSSATSFIGKLISFKRGLNGRGDPRAGLPPSRIHEPVPTEIGAYLNHLADDYLAIIKGAEDIISEQNSITQNKSQVGLTDDGFITEASWWGSRLKARLPGLGLRGPDRKLLLRMLDNSANLEQRLMDIENLLSSSDFNSVYKAFYAGRKLGEGSYESLIDNFKDLIQTNHQLKLAPKPPAETVDEPEIVIEEEEENSPSPVTEEIIEDQEETQRIPFDWEVVEALNKDCVYAQLVLSFLKKRNIISEEDLKLRDKLNLRFNIIKYRKDANIPDQALEDWQVFFNTYNYLLDLAKRVVSVPSAISFKELAPIIVKLQDNTDSVKVAHNPVSRFLKRKWLEHKPSIFKDEDIDSRKITCIDNILEALKTIDVLMNTLQTQDVLPEHLYNSLAEFSVDLSQVYEDLIKLADLHNAVLRTSLKNRDKKSKDLTVTIIPRIDITEMKKLVQLMQSVGSKRLISLPKHRNV
jgi:hypothetical protein